MPTEITRNLEKGGLYVNKFWTGLYTNRGPLYTPVSALGIQLVSRQDTLWAGLNIQITPQFTLRRRYGFLRSCTSGFGSNEFPLTFFSFENLSGTVTPMVDTQTKVYSFTSSSLTAVYTKGTTAQSSFNSVANWVYWCDGTNANKWNGSVVQNMGIATPTVACTSSSTSGTLSPTVGYRWGYCFYNPTTGHLSTMSTPSASSGPQTSKNFTVGGNGSSDTQVTQIWIFRTDDGGAEFYFDAEVSNPGSGTWTYADSTPDASLNDLLIAPLDFVNDPPPANMSLLVWYAGRLWGASGNTLYFSAGPDCTIGVGEEAWPPGNNYTLPGNITALAATSTGLVIFTKDDAYVTTGQTSATFTVPILWQANLGVPNQNCVTQDGDNLFIFTTRGQAWNYGSSGLSEIGFSIEANLGAFTPSKSYIAIHRSGGDEGVFISDGSENVYRYSQVSTSWDTVMQPVGGVGAMMSMEGTDGFWHLFMGRPTGAGYILQRDLNTWTDDGSTYPAWVVIGSLTVSPPRTVALVASIPVQIPAVGTYPTVSVMLNEVEDTGSLPATFTALPNPVPDPPQLPQSLTLWTKRHDLKAAQVPLPQYVQHLQVKIAFAAEAEPNEVWGFGVA